MRARLILRCDHLETACQGMGGTLFDIEEDLFRSVEKKLVHYYGTELAHVVTIERSRLGTWNGQDVIRVELSPDVESAIHSVESAMLKDMLQNEIRSYLRGGFPLVREPKG